MKKTRKRDALLQNATNTHIIHIHAWTYARKHAIYTSRKKKKNTKHAISILSTPNSHRMNNVHAHDAYSTAINIFRRKGQTVQETVYTYVCN